jgi:hypothetical protein
MITPGFTAESSLGKTKDSYALTLNHAAASGRVVPQLFCLPNEGGTTCYQCWNEGGFSGCYSFRIRHFTLF